MKTINESYFEKAAGPMEICAGLVRGFKEVGVILPWSGEVGPKHAVQLNQGLPRPRASVGDPGALHGRAGRVRGHVE